MLEIELFLGFSVDDTFQKKLSQVNPYAVAMFIDDKDEYLQQVTHEGVHYLGKKLGKVIDFNRLELLESNVYSLLRRLVPDYSYEQNPLRVVAIS